MAEQIVEPTRVQEHLRRSETSIKDSIRKRIARFPRKKLFLSSSFRDLGSSDQIARTLSELTKARTIVRVVRGMYMQPESSQHCKVVWPDSYAIANTIAKARGDLLSMQGAEAARRLSLSTGVPLYYIYWTTGPSRVLYRGRLPIQLRHVSNLKLALHRGEAGLAWLSLWYFGERSLTPRIVDKIRRRIPAKEFKKLESKMHLMPKWMVRAFTDPIVEDPDDEEIGMF